MKTPPNPKVDAFLARQTAWKAEFTALRKILLGSGLTEDFKWGQPCYTLDDRNVVLMHGFKAYCALLFFKGALLKDSEKLLVRQTANVQSARQIRFTSTAEINQRKAALRAYVDQAVAVEKAGHKVEFKKTAAFKVPDELKARFAKDPELKEAFHKLTPGRQRAYLLYFGAAKQAKTREARIEKYADQIREGRGMDD